VPAPAADRQLGFYTYLKRFDHRQPDVQAALSFTRVCEDLVQRAASALAAQAGLPYEPPPVPYRSLFQAWLDGACGSLPAAWRENGLPPFESELFGGLCRWLGGAFDLAAPLQTSYQVWVDPDAGTGLAVYGPPAAEPPPGVRLIPHTAPPPCPLPDNCAAFGHYDVHGLAMLALCLRTMGRLGAGNAAGLMNFEMTGDIGKLWKRAVPQAIRGSEAPALVAMIDCPVHSRKPEHTLRALRLLDAHPDVDLLLIDHHPDTLQLAPQLMHPRVRLVLTDVWSCSLLYAPDATDAALRLLGALGDKVPETAGAAPPAELAALQAANAGYHRTLLHFSPTPAPFKTEERQPLEALWTALAAGKAPTEQLIAAKLGLDLPPERAAPPPEYVAAGAIAFVTARLTARGRDWYGLLEGVMQQAGLSYAAALRVLDGSRANMLLLTHWQDTHVPPVRSFVPEAYLSRSLGHPAAVWVDLPLGEALHFLGQVAANVNSFMGSDGDFAPAAAALQANILDHPPSTPDTRDSGGGD
jgi:hypothetical protein